MTANFVRDNTALPGPKLQWDEVSVEAAVPDMWCNSADYNALRSALNDLRDWVKTGIAPGTTTLSTLVVDADGRITGHSSGSGLTDGDKGDVVVSSTGTVFTIDSGVVTPAKMSSAAANSLLGNNSGSPATAAYLTAAQVRTLLGLAAVATSGSAGDLVTGTVPAARMPAFTGPVTTVAGGVATTIAASAIATANLADNAVTNAKLAQMAANTIKGNNTGGAANALDLTAAQVATMLGSVFAAPLALAGGGKDGAISPANASTTTLTKNMSWTTFTVPAGTCTVKCKGFVPLIQKLDLSSGGTVVFHHDGDAAVAGVGATGMVSEGSLKVYSGTGASGIGNAGQPGFAPTTGTWPTSDRAGLGGAGAAGGGGAGGAGGAAPAVITADTEGSIDDLLHFIHNQFFFGSNIRCCGGSGGGSGAGSGAPNFFSGGGGGAGGGFCAVVIGELITPANAANVTVRANGGAGAVGAGGTQGGGGGGGYAGVGLLAGDAATLAAIVVQANGGAGGAGAAPNGQAKRFGGA